MMAQLYLPDDLAHQLQTFAEAQGLAIDECIALLLASYKPENLLHNQIIQNMAEGVNLVYLETDIIAFVNPASAQLFGYTPSELIGQHSRILTEPDFPDEASQERYPEINRSLKATGRWQGEIYNVRKDGSMFWCHANMSTFVHPTFGLVSISVHEDITERKQTHEELQKYRDHLEELVNSRTRILRKINKKLHDEIEERERMQAILHDNELRFRSIFEHAAVGITETDLDGPFLNVNQRFCDIIGYPREEILSLTYCDITHPDDLEEDARQMERILTNKIASFYIEKRYIRKDGTVFWIDLTVSAVHDEAGNIKNMISVVQDVNERKKIEQELTQHRNHLKELVELRTKEVIAANELLERAERINQSGSWHWNLKTGQLQLSKGMYSILGVNEEDIPAIFTIDDFWTFLHPDDLMRIQESIEYITQRSVSDTGEFRIIRKDSPDEETRLVVTEGFAVVDKQGNLIARTGIIRDITEQREMEKSRLDLEIERKRIDVLTSFITHTKHHFQTPISIISTSLYLLQRYVNHDDKHISERLDGIQEQINQISQLVDAMSIIVELDGLQTIDFSTIPITTVIQYAIERVGDKHPQSINYKPHDARLNVKGNIEYLTHAVYCIVDNAIKHTPPDANISIETNLRNDKVIVSIKDTGSGIPANEIPRIFEHFYRRDAAGTTRGLGLGLPIARRIIELHNGQITVESNPDRGTTFSLILPATTASDLP